MSSASYTKSSLFGSLIVGSFALLCVAIVVQAQYNTYDSDANSGKFLVDAAEPSAQRAQANEAAL